jgi:hypothetical protein
MKLIPILLSVAAVALSAAPASAQSGPVGRACKTEIGSLCVGLPHDGSVRICLETNYDRVSPACKRALDTTGGGRGRRFQR